MASKFDVGVRVVIYRTPLSNFYDKKVAKSIVGNTGEIFQMPERPSNNFVVKMDDGRAFFISPTYLRVSSWQRA